MSFKDNVSITLSIIVLCCCLLTLGQFVVFLSSHTSLGNVAECESPWLQVATDVCLVCLFVLQHSLQNHKVIKDILSKYGFGVFERLLYNLGSCSTLQLLMQFWNPVSSWVVWEVSTSNNIIAWLFFVIIHCLAWLLIYSGCFIMDLPELLGAKQVFHSIQGLPDPMSLKSEGLRQFYSHMRHPSFSAMTVILFVHPVMQIDRLLLAYGFVIYMILITKVDDFDYSYQLRMRKRKERDLNFNE